MFVQQKLDKAIKDKETEDLSITGLFKKDYTSFCEEITKYSLNSLKSFHDACQACIDILIEQGIGNEETWADSDSDSNLYDNLYIPYYQKLNAIESELKVRQDEINVIEGVYDSDGILIQNGLQPILNDIKNDIQSYLDFQDYIGNELWLEFCTYRREDKYSNDNYISDGLSNSELFEKALEFIKVAKNEIYKSAELQHSISSSLRNLLMIEKFKPLVKYFKTGNWIRIMVDDKVYKLRLLDFEVDFDNLDSLSVDFSDVLKTASGEVDQKSIMSKITSIATSYSSVKRQANQGKQSNVVLNNWFENGLDLTKTKIINNYDEGLLFDKNGFWCRQYDPITGTYSDEQIKIINSTIAVTDDNWNTTKTAIGKFYYTDAKGEEKVACGVNGETIVGKLFLGESMSMQNKDGSMTFDHNGLTIKNDKNTVTINPNDKEIMNITNGEEKVFNVNEDGDLSINGNIMARSLQLESGVKIDSGVITNLATVATSGSYNDLSYKPTNISDFTNDTGFITKTDLAKVATSNDYDDLDNKPTVQSTIQNNDTSPVNGKAVYDFALSKNQGVSNAGKLLYIDTNGDITTIGIDDLKTLLGI